ncbi:MAG: DEAD/DEAH box helicase family protein, partial [Candidatus Heimdallarchaeota archaeon]|nr:DEAD/DEAH box helicase family protein [Candidatus Heimdallarchaeota archaeon]
MQNENSHLLISPPGSGKTIIGLAVARKLGHHTLILTPNLAVLGSWIDRTEMFLKSDTKLLLSEIINRENGDLRPFTITTYQKINTELKELASKKRKDKTDSTLVSHLKKHNIKFIIFDECHRLTSKWGVSMIQLLSLFPEAKILGLTATPPERETDTFKDIFKDNRSNIPLPYLVRQGILVPYHDIVVTYPSLNELEDVCVSILKDSYPTVIKHLDLDIDPTELKKSTILKSFSNVDIKKILTLQNTGYLSELDFHHLQGFLEVNFIQQNQSKVNENHLRWLYQNSSLKIALTLQIVHKELKNIEDPRILVILEQENHPTEYKFQYKGCNGAIGVFNSLVRDETADLLQPILVTGKSLLVDDDFTEKFLELAEKWIKHHSYDIKLKTKKPKQAKYSIINGTGLNWSTDTYTRLVTYLFEEGYTKLLVGTKFLLGEGWDSRSLNTVIDLTTVTAYMTVNQVKGRALRQNPRVKNKCSNIWEICPNPSSLIPFSIEEYAKYVDKHKNYFGVDSSGNIRNNVNRLNAELLPNLQNSLISETFNQSGFNKSLNRDLFYDLWKVGEELGKLYHVISFTINLEEFDDQNLFTSIIDHIAVALKFCFQSIDIISKNRIPVEVKTINEDYKYTFQVLIPPFNKTSNSSTFSSTINQDEVEIIIDMVNDLNRDNLNSGYLIEFNIIPESARYIDLKELAWKSEIPGKLMGIFLPIPIESVKIPIQELLISEVVRIKYIHTISKQKSFTKIYNVKVFMEGEYILEQQLLELSGQNFKSINSFQINNDLLNQNYYNIRNHVISEWKQREGKLTLRYKLALKITIDTPYRMNRDEFEERFYSYLDLINHSLEYSKIQTKIRLEIIKYNRVGTNADVNLFISYYPEI